MDNLFTHFDARFLINLPERPDRLRSSMAAFSRVGWGGGKSIQIYPAHKFDKSAGFPNSAIRGAFHSHWGCLQRAIEGEAQNVLIMEDDIAFSSSLGRLSPVIASWLAHNEWDIVYFGHDHTGAIPEANSRTSESDLKFQSWSGDIQGLHFYGLNRRIFVRLNCHFKRVSEGAEGDQVYGPMPVDGAINVFRRMNRGVKTFICEPKLGWQRSSRSDITPTKLDKIRLLWPVTGLLRSIKHAAKAVRS